jgi:hypothetical protein
MCIAWRHTSALVDLAIAIKAAFSCSRLSTWLVTWGKTLGVLWMRMRLRKKNSHATAVAASTGIASLSGSTSVDAALLALYAA